MCFLLYAHRILTISLASHEDNVLYRSVYCYINTASGTTQGVHLNKKMAPDINTAVRPALNSFMTLHVWASCTYSAHYLKAPIYCVLEALILLSHFDATVLLRVSFEKWTKGSHTVKSFHVTGSSKRISVKSRNIYQQNLHKKLYSLYASATSVMGIK
jgi:hypothetical protein